MEENSNKYPELFYRKYPGDNYEHVIWPTIAYNPDKHDGHLKRWVEEIGVVGDYLVKIDKKIYSYTVREVPKPKVIVERA